MVSIQTRKNFKQYLSQGNLQSAAQSPPSYAQSVKPSPSISKGKNDYININTQRTYLTRHKTLNYMTLDLVSKEMTKISKHLLLAFEWQNLESVSSLCCQSNQFLSYLTLRLFKNGGIMFLVGLIGFLCLCGQIAVKIVVARLEGKVVDSFVRYEKFSRQFQSHVIPATTSLI